jgi:hypothetical protein
MLITALTAATGPWNGVPARQDSSFLKKRENPCQLTVTTSLALEVSDPGLIQRRIEIKKEGLTGHIPRIPNLGQPPKRSQLVWVS